MTTPDQQQLEADILSRRSFLAAVDSSTQISLRADFETVSWSTPIEEPRWPFALLCSSALTPSRTEEAQTAILRIATGCLLSESAGPAHRESAALLLQRLGNHLGVELARARGYLPRPELVATPTPLKLDALARVDRLTIQSSHGPIVANQFQADFWETVTRASWVSVSAPTSAGKSHIVRQWILDSFNRTSRDNAFSAAYLAPTRALVEEVAQQLRIDLPPDVKVATLPWDSAADDSLQKMVVMTQERLHLMQQRDPDFAPQLMFVDEAQNAGDGARGVLMSRVIDESVRRNPSTQVIFASPMASNPELLLDGAPDTARGAEALLGSSITVSQNLLFARQVRGRPLIYDLALVSRTGANTIGTFSLPTRATRAGQRLPFVSVALGHTEGGNITYANGAADAENIASQIADLLPDPASDVPVEVLQAIEYVQGAIHPRYQLANVLRRGVAFHYGNMPLQVKALIESLFKSGHVRYLVCTSTLLEGVNLPCRNIFMRGPRKGRGRPMTTGDFWNLAGRAGRWGSEFQGNIICVDVHDDEQWPIKPAARERIPLTRAADLGAAQVAQISSYINSGASQPAADADSSVEAIFSLLAARLMAGRDPLNLAGTTSSPEAARLLPAIQSALAGVRVPASLAGRHAGISPVSMQRLLEALRAGDLSNAQLLPPEDDDAVDSYKRALDLISRYLGGDFNPDSRRFVLARLIVQWMRGFPLSLLIDNRVRYLRRQGQEFKLATEIRRIMKEVEEIARFQAPKYLSCYLDLLSLAAHEADVVLDIEIPDITMMLELGVPRTTDMSLISLGLSRATTLAIAPFITSSDLSPDEVNAWIREHDIGALNVAAFAVREIRQVLGLETSHEGGDVE